MAMAYGFFYLAFLLEIGGGMALPLGVPPLPEDPVMARVAPDECLFYMTWSATAEPDAASSNRTEQLLAEPEIRHMIDQIGRIIGQVVSHTAKKSGPESVPLAKEGMYLAKTLLTHSTALFISEASFETAEPQESGAGEGKTFKIKGGMVVHLGDKLPRVETALKMYQTMFLRDSLTEVDIDNQKWSRLYREDDDIPTVTWGTRDGYLIAGIGESVVEDILQQMRTEQPRWLGELREQLPVERVSSVVYVNIKSLADLYRNAADQEREGFQSDLQSGMKVLQVLGIDKVRSLGMVAGLDGDGFVSKTLLSVEGPQTGLFELLSDQPLEAADLAPVPADSSIAGAARVNLSKAMELIIATAEVSGLETGDDILKGIAEAETTMGFKIREDILDSLGDVWCVYNSPSEGGLLFTGMTMTVPVTNHARLAAVHQKLREMAGNESAEESGVPPLRHFDFQGKSIFYLSGGGLSGMAPAWCLTEKELIIATCPPHIKAYLSHGPEHRSLAGEPSVARLFAADGGPAAISYVDSKKLLELFYWIPAVAASFGSAFGSEFGFDEASGDVDFMSILPSAPAIGRHLEPAITTLRRTPAGIEMVSRRTIPGGAGALFVPMASYLGVGGMFFSPFISDAERVDTAFPIVQPSADDLEQIAQAILAYEKDKGEFPPAYSSDEDGKPLLSWRVLILPYLGEKEKELYDRFHQDEPWDSEDNKKLLGSMPDVYVMKSVIAAPTVSGLTAYVTLRGEETMFPGKKAVKAADVKDGLANTIMVVQLHHLPNVVWTSPSDFVYDANNLAKRNITGGNVAFGDGSVRSVHRTIDAKIISGLSTRAGGENVSPKDLHNAPTISPGSWDPYAPPPRIEPDDAESDQPAAPSRIAPPAIEPELVPGPG